MVNKINEKQACAVIALAERGSGVAIHAATLRALVSQGLAIDAGPAPMSPSGRVARLTQEGVALAAALRGPCRPGRPPGPPGSQRTARLVVRVTPAELSAYQAAAGRAVMSMGEWVRARLAAGDWSANRSHDWSEVNGRRCARCHVRRTDEGASAFCTQQGAWTAAAEKEHGG